MCDEMKMEELKAENKRLVQGVGTWRREHNKLVARIVKDQAVSDRYRTIMRNARAWVEADDAGET
jgi:hypothetical protein